MKTEGGITDPPRRIRYMWPNTRGILISDTCKTAGHIPVPGMNNNA